MAKSVLDTPVGGTGKFLVTMDGNPFVSFDTRVEADKYVLMMRNCKKGGKKGDNAPAAFCATRNWDIKER